MAQKLRYHIRKVAFFGPDEEGLVLGAGLVVVIEDDRAVRDVITDLLEGEGYAVHAIGDGRSVYESIYRIANTLGPIAAITLDLTLPGKDGTSILKELKANSLTREVPVVVVSANMPLLSPETRHLAAAVVRKPFDVMHLLDTVSAVIARYSPAVPPFPAKALANGTIRR